MRHRQENAFGTPHQNEFVLESPADLDASVPPDSATDSRDPPDRCHVGITLNETGNPASFRERMVSSARPGGDGAALLSTASIMPRWKLLVTGGDEAIGSCAWGAQRECNRAPREAPRRGYDRQINRRREERELRKRSVVFYAQARTEGWSTEETAEVLGLSPRTSWHWDDRWQTDRLASHPRGRPPRIAVVERQAEATRFLEAHGPSISLATLRAEYPDIARAELALLRARYRTEWQLEHGVEQCRLTWLCPGSVWAMDFTHAPHRIDGIFPAIFNVVDLASHQQLLWLAVERENAATVVEALGALIAQHGAPLVIKCDNGPAFRAELTKRLLLDREIFPLYSPPYCAAYNGACERANRTLKELTAHIAEQEGRPGFWTSEDLFEARLRANRLSRPWGAHRATPEETWTARGVLSLDKRDTMRQHLKRGIATVLDQRGIDPTVALSHYTQAEIERIAAQPVLEQLGLLRVTRRRIAPVF